MNGGGGRKREEEDNSARSFLRAEEEKVCPCAAAVLGKALTQSLYPFGNEGLGRRPNLHFLFSLPTLVMWVAMCGVWALGGRSGQGPLYDGAISAAARTSEVILLVLWHAGGIRLSLVRRLPRKHLFVSLGEY
ncbi:hypothetical protein CEXT_690991 [Caerostris extrusa]|uniref:Uncharacterized protein n=1 Tax=Caerostris extrusa TaxID=172846 RepID=A0AAV4MBD2_CAEEX|nr:hypothetical protein CEXT_690991 [Caerostris extrusa]